MSRVFIITALTVTVVMLAILTCGCSKEESPMTDLANATPVRGQVFSDGRLVAGAHVEAVSVDGTRRISNMTNDSGTYVLGLQPGIWYKITARSGSLKHTVLPVYLIEDGNWTSEYNINLTGLSTIEGSPRADSQWKGKGIYIVAAPVNGDEPIMTVTGEDGNYSLTVKPGVYYTVTATSYDPGGTAFGATLYYRNSIECTRVKPGPGETILLDYLARIPYPAPPSLIVNGTVGVTGKKVEPPARTSTTPVPAGGHVYLDNKAVKGARVEAISIDGTDRVSAMTNGTGVYVLMLEPEIMYRATATYNGLKHTIWPLSHTQNATDGRNEILLMTKSHSAITVYYQQGYQDEGERVLIEATPAEGGEPVITLTDGPGNYSLEVKPGVKYTFGGRCYDAFGQNGYVNIQYPRDGPDTGIIVGPDETMIADMSVSFVHPPKSIYMWRDPATGGYDLFKPPVPVTATGHVYIDGQPASGANVTARMSGSSDGTVSTTTDDSGAYVLRLTSRRQYEITAAWQGLEHTVGPVIVQDDTIGVYNIQLTRTPGSIISGTIDPDQGWPVLSGNVITAAPVGGGTPATAISDADGGYSLNVEPFTYYDISGKSPGEDGQYHDLRFYYRNSVSCSGFMLRPNETALVNYWVA